MGIKMNKKAKAQAKFIVGKSLFSVWLEKEWLNQFDLLCERLDRKGMGIRKIKRSALMRIILDKIDLKADSIDTIIN